MVAEGVLFGVEDGVLDGQRQGVKLGEELLQGADLEELLEADRGLGGVEEEFKQFLVHPFDAQPGEVDVPGGFVDLGIDLESQDRGEPGGAQNPQGVIGEGAGVGHPDRSGARVLPAVEGVDEDPALEPEGHAVRPEVPPLEVFLDGEPGIGGDDEVLVALGAGRLGGVRPGQGDIIGHAADGKLDDSEAPAHLVHFAVGRELSDDVFQGMPGDEKVDLGGRAAEDEVPDIAADGIDVRPEEPDEKAFVPEIRLDLLHGPLILPVFRAGWEGQRNSRLGARPLVQFDAWNFARRPATASLWVMNINTLSFR